MTNNPSQNRDYSHALREEQLLDEFERLCQRRETELLQSFLLKNAPEHSRVRSECLRIAAQYQLNPTLSDQLSGGRSSTATERTLLYGLLALQCGFISKEQLVSSFSVWTSNKQRPIDLILIDQQSLTPQQQSLLSALVEEHLKQHGDDPEQSLAALSTLPPIVAELKEIADSELHATLMHVNLKEAPDNDPAATITVNVAPSQSSRFVILRKHAKGGLGQVSVALDSELNRHVALKEILPKCADDPLAQGRFILEAEITGQLEHPGIVPVYGLGTYADGRPYYAMRFVEGENLKRAIESFHKDRSHNATLTGARAIEFRNLLGRFIDVCNAIEYAHSRKVLHRDLKPENILLGPYGETLVVDWGLAKALGASELQSAPHSPSRPVRFRGGSNSETIAGTAVGTPAYMSPEQAEGKIQELGPATDVYSLGATLYALLTGKPPVKSDTVVEVLEKVRRNEIDRPRLQWASIPKPLEAVCLRAMSLKPSDRYGSAKEFGDEIEKWLADEPVKAFPEGLVSRSKRWLKRHPATVSTTLACILLGFGVATFVAYLQGAHAKEITAKNSVLESKNATINRQLEELTKKNETISTQVKTLESQNQVISAQKEEIQKQYAIVTKQKQEVEIKNKTIEKQSSDLELKNESLQEQNAVINRQKGELESTNTELAKQKKQADDAAEIATAARNEAIKANIGLSDQLVIAKELTSMHQNIFGFICPQTQGNVIGTLKSEVSLYERRLGSEFQDNKGMRRELLNSLGIISYGLQEYGQASRLFHEAHEISLEDKHALGSNELEIALNWFKAARELPAPEPTEGIAGMMKRSLLQPGQLQVSRASEKDFGAVISQMETTWGALDQRTIDARYLLAEQLEGIGLLDKAQTELESILQLQSNDQQKAATSFAVTRVRLIELLGRNKKMTAALALFNNIISEVESEYGSGSNELITANNEMLSFAEGNAASTKDVAEVIKRLVKSWANLAENSGDAEKWAIAKRNEVWALQRLGERAQAEVVALSIESASRSMIDQQIKATLLRQAADASQLIGLTNKASELNSQAIAILAKLPAPAPIPDERPVVTGRNVRSRADDIEELRNQGFAPNELSRLAREPFAQERMARPQTPQYDDDEFGPEGYERQAKSPDVPKSASSPTLSRVVELAGAKAKDTKTKTAAGALPGVTLRRASSATNNK